jgi:hypothetical protein
LAIALVLSAFLGWYLACVLPGRPAIDRSLDDFTLHGGHGHADLFIASLFYAVWFLYVLWGRPGRSLCR